MEYKLMDVQPGYAEVWFWYGEKTDDGESDKLGVVEREEFVYRTDFENDKVYKVKRWIAGSYLPPDLVWVWTVGNTTGYRTRKEAIEALIEYWTKDED